MSSGALSISWAPGIDGHKHVNTVVKKIGNCLANAFKERSAIMLTAIVQIENYRINLLV